MAGLIPQNFIDDLLSRVDIVDVIDKRIKLRKTGKNYSALCPFHKEKSPSFSVQPEKQFYYCFGCGAGGNALGFVMEFDNKDFPQAVESLAVDYGLTVPREESREQDRQRSENQQVLDVLAKADAWYQQQLRRHAGRQRAVNYLKKRGLSGQIARDFNIGFAPPGWEGLLTALGTQGVSPELMVKAGLLIEREARDAAGSGPGSGPASRKDGYYDRFRDRIIFPIRDNRGRVIAFGGRVLGDEKPKYLNSPETPVYHKGQELYGLFEARRSRERLTRFLIVEGYMDVVALAQHGIHYAVATLGTATNSTHLTRLFRLVPEVIYCFDGDEAGRTAAWRGLQATLPVVQDGRRVRFLFLPEGEDPDTLIRKIGKDKFSEHVDNATNLEDFFFDHLSAEVDVTSMEGKARLATLAAPLLNQLPDGIFRQLMRKRLIELTDVDGETIDRLLKARKPSQPAAGGQRAAASVDLGAPPSDRSADWSNDDMPPGWDDTSCDGPPDWTQNEAPGSAQARPPGRPVSPGRRAGKGTIERPASLKAIELLLYRPQIALELQQDLTPMADLKDASTDLLLELIELVKVTPNISTYAMLGHCYGTPLGNQLTQLMKSEKITPHEGIKDEFTFLIDSIIANATRLQFRRQLLEQLKPRLKPRSTADDQSAGSSD